MLLEAGYMVHPVQTCVLESERYMAVVLPRNRLIV